MKKLIVVVDMQNDFIDGALGTQEGKNLPVPHCIKPEHGWKITDALQKFVDKAAFPEVTLAVDASCCAGVIPESHATALAAMKMCQIEIRN